MKQEHLVALVGIVINVAVIIFFMTRLGGMEKKIESLYQAHVSDIKAMVSVYNGVLLEQKILIETLAVKSKVDIKAVLEEKLPAEAKQARAAVLQQGTQGK